MGWREDLMAQYNQQNFLPEMGLQSGFSPLTDLGIEEMADYSGVNTEKTDYENLLSQLQGLPQSNANWDGMGATSLHGDIPWSGNGFANQQTPDGSSAWGSPQGYQGDNQWANFGWRPEWPDLASPVSQGGIGYESYDPSLWQDPNYNPGSLTSDEYPTGFSGGQYNPAFAATGQNISQSNNSLFRNTDQWATEPNIDDRWGRDYSPMLQGQLGALRGSNYMGSAQPSGTNFNPSYVDTGWNSGYNALKMPYSGESTGCVLPGTKIETKRGKINIEDTKQDDLIRIYDFKTKKFGWSPIDVIFNDTVEEGWSELETASGKKLNCSNSHLMYHPEYKFNAVATDHLGIGGELYIVNEDGEIEADTIVSIKVHDEPVEVWNYELELTHNYISNGILSHNRQAKNMPHLTVGATNNLPTLLQSKKIHDSSGVFPGDTTSGPYNPDVEKWQKYFSSMPEKLMGKPYAPSGIPDEQTDALMDYSTKMALGAQAGTSDATGLAQAWNVIPQRFNDSNRGVKLDKWGHMDEGGDITGHDAKMGMKWYMGRGLRGWQQGAQAPANEAGNLGGAVDDTHKMMTDYLKDDWNASFGPSGQSVQNTESDIISDAYTSVDRGPLGPKQLKDVNSGVLGIQEKAATDAIQAAWNAPGADSLQGSERAKRQTLQESEMTALKAYNDYRRDSVIGTDVDNQGTLLGDVSNARDAAGTSWFGTGGLRDQYQGISGSRPGFVDSYDDFLSNRIASGGLGMNQYHGQRQSDVETYQGNLGGTGTSLGLQAQLDADIADKYYQYRADVGGDGSLESTELNKWNTQFDSAKLGYEGGLADLTTDYELQEGELANVRQDALSTASRDSKTAQRELDTEMTDTGDMSRLRRDIRGFVGGNILSGRRERRANEERASALGSRAELLNQQKKITSERRNAQKEARKEWKDEQDALVDRTELSATDLFTDVEDTLQPVADEVETQLGIYQDDMSQDLVGSPSSSLNIAKNTKGNWEAETAGSIEDMGATMQESLTNTSTPFNYEDTYSNIADKRTHAGNQVTGVGGLQDTYEGKLYDTTQTSLNRHTPNLTQSGVANIPSKRATYLDAIGGPTGAIKNLGSTIKEQASATKGLYGQYTDNPSGPYARDLTDSYLSGGSTSNIPRKLGASRETFAQDYSTGLNKDIGSGGPWGSDPEWVPDYIMAPKSAGQNTLSQGYWDKPYELFGTSYKPIAGWNSPGWEGHGNPSTSFGGSGFGREAITSSPSYNPNNKWNPFDYYGWEWPTLVETGGDLGGKAGTTSSIKRRRQ